MPTYPSAGLSRTRSAMAHELAARDLDGCCPRSRVTSVRYCVVPPVDCPGGPSCSSNFSSFLTRGRPRRNGATASRRAPPHGIRPKPWSCARRSNTSLPYARPRIGMAARGCKKSPRGHRRDPAANEHLSVWARPEVSPERLRRMATRCGTCSWRGGRARSLSGAPSRASAHVPSGTALGTTFDHHLRTPPRRASPAARRAAGDGVRGRCPATRAGWQGAARGYHLLGHGTLEQDPQGCWSWDFGHRPGTLRSHRSICVTHPIRDDRQQDRCVICPSVTGSQGGGGRGPHAAGTSGAKASVRAAPSSCMAMGGTEEASQATPITT